MLKIKSVVVKHDRIIAVIQLDSHESFYTDADLIGQVLQYFPHLPLHTCLNSRGTAFADVMDHTSIPHLLEHLVIDIQSEKLSDNEGKALPLTGITKWIKKSEGLAQLQLSFYDDLVALDALNKAVSFLNSLT